MATRDERDIWLDALRGIAILMVVVGHALRGLDTAGIATGGLFAFLDPRLYAVHVQLLFFVSGLLVVRSLARRGAGPFGVSRFATLLLPMLFWTYVFLGAKVLAGPYQNEPVAWDALLVSPVPGQLHLWFLWALLLMHLMAAVLWALVPARRRPAAFLVLLGVSLVAAAWRLPAEADRWVGQAAKFLPFFALGMVLALYDVRSRRTASVALVAGAAAVLAFVFAPQIAAGTGLRAAPSLIACLGAYFSASAVLALPRLTTGAAFLGASAMAIYVLHTIFSAGTREALLAAGIAAPAPHLLLGLLAGIVLPILVRESCLRARVARPLALA